MSQTQTFPACKHRKKKTTPTGLRWLAAEPFRIFFISGALWSIVGVSLWLLYHAGRLSYYPSYSHARIMIEAFGGAFVVGFLGTAGPRMASAPKLTPVELIVLLILHEACAVCHLMLHHAAGDILFALLLIALLSSLATRVIRFRKEMPPPQLLLALSGLLCGTVGSLLTLFPATWADLAHLRLAGLLLYQGLLLPPVLGIGSFLFPRIFGGSFGEAGSAREEKLKRWRAAGAALLLIASFPLDACFSPLAGGLLRAATCAAYLLAEVKWRQPGPARGTIARALPAALVLGLLGLIIAAFFPVQHASAEHLLYIGGFGLLIVIVSCRVLFGHGGDLAGFSQRTWIARILVFLPIAAAVTRAVTGFVPAVTVSHHIYAASMWALLMLIWLIWHRRRFITHEEE